MPTTNKKKLKPYIYTHKNKMKNIGLAMKLKSQKRKKETKSKSKSKSTVVENKKQSSISIREMIIFTKENDPKFKQYSNKAQFKELAKKNPTIFVVNAIFLSLLQTSFIDRLLEKENIEIANCLNHFILLKTEQSKFDITNQLVKHGFNTIYDILLENPESVYLFSFLAHAASIGLITNTDKFIKNLHKNKLHKDLRSQKVIEQLQVSNLYTRVKRFQLS